MSCVEFCRVSPARERKREGSNPSPCVTVYVFQLKKLIKSEVSKLNCVSQNGKMKVFTFFVVVYYVVFVEGNNNWRCLD